MEQGRFCPVFRGLESLHWSRVSPPPIFKTQGSGALPSRYRFFEATGLAILTVLVQHYKVEPHPKFFGESFERLKEKYSQGSILTTLR